MRGIDSLYLITDVVSSFGFQGREAYKKYMKKIAKFLGGGPDSDEEMMKVFDLETELAKVRKIIHI